MNTSSVVLFNHPGDEHKPRRGQTLFAWNTKPHRRKYLTVEAYVASSTGVRFSRSRGRERVALWGEFEPSTLVRRFARPSSRGEPQSWHRLRPMETPPPHAQNTDPWIFGETFRYGYCRQLSVGYLQTLQPGDLILFGSYLQQEEDGRPATSFNFFLDTAFVVSGGFPLGDVARLRPTLLDPEYRRAAYDRFPTAERDKCTLYEAAMLRTLEIEAPFSFAPCVRWTRGDEPPKMRRPMVGQLFGKSFGNGQTFTRMGDWSPAEAWRRIVAHCRNRGYDLAVQVTGPGLAVGSTDVAATRATCGTRKAVPTTRVGC